MRLVSIALLSALTALAAACGGGKKDPDAAGPRPDSRVNPDAPVTSACLMAATYDRDFDDPPDGEIDVLSLGNETTPIDIDGQKIDVDQDGTPETWAIAIIGVLDTLEPEIPEHHGYQFLLIDNAGMFAPPNTFDTGPMPAAAALDSGDTCGGCLQAWGGWADGAQIDLNTATQVYLKDEGTLTVATFNPPLVEGGSSVVAGTFDNIVMTGFDPVAGTPLDPPCTTQVTQLGFGFNMSWVVAAAKPNHVERTASNPYGIDWSKAPRVRMKRGL
jgi:hypothetical protein